MLGLYTKEILIVFFTALVFLLGSTGSDPPTDKPPEEIVEDKEI